AVDDDAGGLEQARIVLARPQVGHRDRHVLIGPEAELASNVVARVALRTYACHVDPVHEYFHIGSVSARDRRPYVVGDGEGRVVQREGCVVRQSRLDAVRRPTVVFRVDEPRSTRAWEGPGLQSRDRGDQW